MRVASLCDGSGLSEYALRLALPGARTVLRVERDAYAAATLVEAMAAGRLDAAPLWSDLRTLDGRPWRGAVDCVVAGYPCQPFSSAGQRLGTADPRHLWPFVRRFIWECEPRIVVLENVARHLVVGYREVRAWLEGQSYRVTEGLVSAAEVGAGHIRRRLFVLAVRSDATGEGWRLTRDAIDGTRIVPDRGRAVHAGGCGRVATDAERGGLRHEHRRSAGAHRNGAPLHQLDGAHGADPDERGCALVGESECGGIEGACWNFAHRCADDRQLGWTPTESSVADSVGVGQHEGRAECAELLGISEAPDGRVGEWWDAFERAWGVVPWFGAWESRPPVRGVAHGIPHRVDRLRLTGNAWVPLQGAYAITMLWRELFGCDSA
ncbi:MAG TPA: DNA cytosine methyltransferase [Candidatus Limnocylindria bacterium]|nr:DNA cytosine methyltransferase [Candidatus Limnocylindria bacterium]